LQFCTVQSVSTVNIVTYCSSLLCVEFSWLQNQSLCLQ
jgi:hypothetical protein